MKAIIKKIGTFLLKSVDEHPCDTGTHRLFTTIYSDTKHSDIEEYDAILIERTVQRCRECFFEELTSVRKFGIRYNGDGTGDITVISEESYPSSRETS